MLRIRGHGVLTIGDKEIPFENKANTNFLMAPMNLIDLQGMGGGAYESFGLMELPCNSFQILSDPYDQDMNKIYNRLAFVSINSFTAAIQKPTKVVLRGGGQFNEAGIARSAGFNVVCAEGAFSGVVPYVNIPRRRARVRVTGVSSVPFTTTWVYHPTNKALYGYRDDSAEIWKIGFDIDTGVYSGDPVLLTDQFTFGNSGYRTILTDGVSRLFRLNGSNFNSIIVYDLETEQLSTLSLSSSVDVYSGVGDKFWDDLGKKIYVRGLLLANNQLYEIDPDTGQVETLTFPGRGNTPFSSVYALNEYFMMEQRAIRARFELSDLALSSTSTSGTTGYFTEYFNKFYRFPDSSGWVITGTFDNTLGPGSLQLEMVKEPDTAYTMIAIPPTEVEVDTPFSIEYTLEVVGG